MPKGVYKKSEAHKQKLRLYRVGKKHTEESKIKSGVWRGKKRPPFSEKWKENIGKTRKGEKLSVTTKHRMSESAKGKHRYWLGKKRLHMTGEKHPFWQGGISESFYPPKFNKILKLKIRTRDNFICCLCGKTEREELEELNRVLCVNHIDFDKNNCEEYNLNTLCLRCNVKIGRDRDYWINYFKVL